MFVTTVCVVDIYTTEGVSFSAKSAKDCGTGFAFTKNDKLTNNIEINNILRFLNFILFFYIPNNKKTNNSED